MLMKYSITFTKNHYEQNISEGAWDLFTTTAVYTCRVCYFYILYILSCLSVSFLQPLVTYEFLAECTALVKKLGEVFKSQHKYK